MRLFRLFNKNYCSTTEPIKETIGNKIARLKGTKILELREIGDEQAKKELLEFIKWKESVYPSDIADALRLPLDQVFRIINGLFAEGRVEEAG